MQCFFMFFFLFIMYLAHSTITSICQKNGAACLYPQYSRARIYIRRICLRKQNKTQQNYIIFSFIKYTKISKNFNSFKETFALSNSLKYVSMTAEYKLFILLNDC